MWHTLSSPGHGGSSWALGLSCWAWALALSTGGVHSTRVLQVSLGGGEARAGPAALGSLCQQDTGRAQHHSQGRAMGTDPRPLITPRGRGGRGAFSPWSQRGAGDTAGTSGCPCSSLSPCPSPAAGNSPFISQGGTNGAVRCHQPRDMTGCGAGAPRTEQPCLSEPPDTPHNGQMDETLKVGPGAFSTLFWVKTLLERS